MTFAHNYAVTSICVVKGFFISCCEEVAYQLVGILVAVAMPVAQWRLDLTSLCFDSHIHSQYTCCPWYSSKLPWDNHGIQTVDIARSSIITVMSGHILVLRRYHSLEDEAQDAINKEAEHLDRAAQGKMSKAKSCSRREKVFVKPCMMWQMCWWLSNVRASTLGCRVLGWYLFSFHEGITDNAIGGISNFHCQQATNIIGEMQAQTYGRYGWWSWTSWNLWLYDIHYDFPYFYRLKLDAARTLSASLARSHLDYTVSHTSFFCCWLRLFLARKELIPRIPRIYCIYIYRS